MKKYIIFILFILILLPTVARASTATCVYETKSSKYYLYYEYGKKPTMNGSAGRNYKEKIINVTNSDIVDSKGNFSCPKLNIESRTVDKGKWKLTVNVSSNGISGKLQDLVDDGRESNPTDMGHICIYNENEMSEYTLQWKDGALKVELTGDAYANYCAPVIKSEFYESDFADGKCPNDLYVQNISRAEGVGNCKGELIISKNKIFSEDDIVETPDSTEDTYTGENKDYIDVISPELELEIKPETCQSLLGNPKTEGTPSFYISFVFKILRYIAIIILIVLTVMDFVGAVASQDNDIIKKATSKAITRAIMCVGIFLLPTIIEFVLQFIHNTSITDCVDLSV